MKTRFLPPRFIWNYKWYQRVYSIAEVVDDSNKRLQKTLFLNLYKEDDRQFSEQMNHSLKAVENLLKENGVKCFDTIESVVEFLNR